MRLLLLCIAILLITPASAQKKEISQARTYVKSRTNLDKAEASMLSLLKDSANRRNIKVHETLAEVMRAQYETINEKLYLKTKLDTVSFFDITRRMFLAHESLDSIDAMPDKRGQVKLKQRKKNSKYLDSYRQNLFNGGLFFIRNKKYDKAYQMMDTYIDCIYQPLFADFDYGKDIKKTSDAAFWTLFCGYKSDNADMALKYADTALKSDTYRMRALGYLSEIYRQKKDTANYIEVLDAGFKEDKKSKFFFTRLIDYYSDKGLLDSAMTITDEALACDSSNTLFMLAKSNLLLNTGKYADCIDISDVLISRQDTIADVYLNAGVSYINLALAEEKATTAKKTKNKQAADYYKKALPYMEKYRQMAPDKKNTWAPALYNVYLKLNMGSQFEEISGVLRNMRQ